MNTTFKYDVSDDVTVHADFNAEQIKIKQQYEGIGMNMELSMKEVEALHRVLGSILTKNSNKGKL